MVNISFSKTLGSKNRSEPTTQSSLFLRFRRLMVTRPQVRGMTWKCQMYFKNPDMIQNLDSLLEIVHLDSFSAVIKALRSHHTVREGHLTSDL